VTLRETVRTAVSSLLVGALLALMGCGSSKATLRVLNATPNESQIDVSLDSTSFATSVSYGTATGYSSVTSGSRDLEIYPSGVTTAYINTTIDLSSGSTYTVMSANVLSNASALLLTDDNSTPSIKHCRTADRQCITWLRNGGCLCCIARYKPEFRVAHN
jgi:Domain of unknown function (DUF4397)